jgi:hypothetical protein
LPKDAKNHWKTRLDLRQALQIHEEVVAASEETLGEQHPYTLRFTHDLALALQRRRRTQDAEQLHRKVLQIELDTLGDKHPQTLRSRDSLGCLLRATGAQRKYTRIELNHIEYHSIIFVHIEALHWPPTNSNNFNHA